MSESVESAERFARCPVCGSTMARDHCQAARRGERATNLLRVAYRELVRLYEIEGRGSANKVILVQEIRALVFDALSGPTE